MNKVVTSFGPHLSREPNADPRVPKSPCPFPDFDPRIPRVRAHSPSSEVSLRHSPSSFSANSGNRHFFGCRLTLGSPEFPSFELGEQYTRTRGMSPPKKNFTSFPSSCELIPEFTRRGPMQVPKPIRPRLPPPWPLPCPTEMSATPISKHISSVSIAVTFAGSFASVRRCSPVHGRVPDPLQRRQEVLAEAASAARWRDERQTVPVARPTSQATVQAGHERERQVPALQARPEQVRSLTLSPCAAAAQPRLAPRAFMRLMVARNRSQVGGRFRADRAAAQRWHRPSSHARHRVRGGHVPGRAETLDGGVIRPPSAEPAEPAAAAGTGSSSGSAGSCSSAAMPPPPPPSAAHVEVARRTTALLMAAGRPKAAGKQPAAVPPRAVPSAAVPSALVLPVAVPPVAVPPAAAPTASTFMPGRRLMHVHMSVTFGEVIYVIK